MRIILTLIVLFVTAQAVWGQASSRNPYFTPFSQYYFQQSVVNPAYVGNENQPQFWVAYQTARESYGSNSEGNGKAFNGLLQGRMYSAPINYGFLFSYEDFNDDREGVNGARGDFRQMQFGLQGSFDFDLGESGIGRVGLTGALLYHNSDIIANNSASTGGAVRKVFPSLDVGIIAIYGNFEFGMSMVNSAEPSFGVNTGLSTGGGGVGTGGGLGGQNNQTTFRRTSFLTMLYNWELTQTLSLHPQFLLRLGNGQLNAAANPQGGGLNLSGVSLDLTMLVNYYDLLFVGFSYKPDMTSGNSSFANSGFVYENYFGTAMLGVRLADAYQVSLSWDLVRSGIQNKDRFRKFEIGIGAFLFDNFYFEEVEEPDDL